jgi:hypothetical protein
MSCLLLACSFLFRNKFLFCSSIYYFRGAQKSPKLKEAIQKEAIGKEAIRKEAIREEAIQKEAINCFLFIEKEAIASFGDFLVSFCETLLCVERLACISKFLVR